ncbi:MAG: arginine--tRNA ligase [Phycisphaerales bacterium JB039]
MSARPASLDPVEILAERFRSAIRAAVPEAPEDVDPLIGPSKRAELGDFQSNCAMPLSKLAGKPPREIAEAIVAKVNLGGVAEPLGPDAIAGPGFINIRLDRTALAGLVAQLDHPELGLPPAADPETVVVDLCGVNLAKQMHVGHLRATVIGDAIARTLERLGHTVIRQSHVGDWGLPIAMVVTKLRDMLQRGEIKREDLTLDELDRLYRASHHECTAGRSGLTLVRQFDLGPKAEAELEAEVADSDEHLTAAKATLVRLQAHDPATVEVWKTIADVTMSACLAACARLRAHVTAEHSAGESSYAEQLPKIVADLESRGVAEVSDGALVVRIGGIVEPALIRKRDGGFLYATTDIAAIKRRVQDFGADRVIYCVDARQTLHFRQVFGASHKAGYSLKPGASEPSRLEHAAFGTILGEDGRPFKTRSGENVKLTDLLDEAEQRAERVVLQKNPDLTGDQQRQVAETVAIAAIKYTDLCTDRVRDYVFSFDRMLTFEGNTGPYLLYALVRIRSIFREAKQRGIPEDWADAQIHIEHPAEKDLALTLLRYPSVVRAVGDTLEPHRMCAYLYDLAQAYSGFYDKHKVLTAETDQARRSRMRLCALTGRVLADGLTTLGIPTLERM